MKRIIGMKKLIACLTVLAVAAPLATPAIASASPSASYVASVIRPQFAAKLRQRLARIGVVLIRTSMTCTRVGGSRYSCYGTYTANSWGFQPVTVGDPIVVNWPSGWQTVGRTTVLRVG